MLATPSMHRPCIIPRAFFPSPIDLVLSHCTVLSSCSYCINGVEHGVSGNVNFYLNSDVCTIMHVQSPALLNRHYRLIEYKIFGVYIAAASIIV